MAQRPTTRRAGLIVVGLLGLISIAALAACGRGPTPAPGTAEVVRVIDGDTVVLELTSGTETVRLIGVDTPETVDPDRPVGCYGPEASEHLGDLLPEGETVRVARDAEPRDRYGRLLAYVWAPDGTSVNADLVAGGYGEVLSIPPNTARSTELAAAEAEARAEGRGLWSAC